MKIVKPTYYDDFKCIADKCPESCCIGWRVDVDKKSFQKYRAVRGPMKQKLNLYISRNRSENADDQAYGKIKLDEKNRCCFLNDKNLCELYIELGEQSMCTVCKTYPRALNQFNHIYERHLTISCPVVSHMVLSLQEPMAFVLVEEELSELDYDMLEKQNLNEKTLLLLNDMRLLFVTIAQRRELPIWKRLLLMRQNADIVDYKVAHHTYEESNLEALYATIEHKKTLEELGKLSTHISTKYTILYALVLWLETKNGGLEEILNDAELFNEKIKQNELDIEMIENEFNNFLKDKEVLFEQYIVYYLFSHFMCLDSKKGIALEITKLLLRYALIRYFMQVTWYRQDKYLSQEDMEHLVCISSRVTEHTFRFEMDLEKQDILDVLKSLDCCSILIR